MTSILFNQTVQLIDELKGTKTASHPETQTSIPGLHLVWYYKELYVKPLPKCLFSYGFWEKHLTEQEQSSNKSSKRRAALGFVRSYAYLIRHESDFRYRHGWDTIQSCEQLTYRKRRTRREPRHPRKANLQDSHDRKSNRRTDGDGRRFLRQPPIERQLRRHDPQVSGGHLERGLHSHPRFRRHRIEPSEELVDRVGDKRSAHGSDKLAPEQDIGRHAQFMASFEIAHQVCGLNGSGLGDCAGNQVDVEGERV
jgi:hypothetical protein